MTPLPPLPPSASALAIDGRGLDAIRQRAGADPRGAAREAAKAFEALFVQEVLKSMRAATMSAGLLDNEGSQLGTQMLDAQLATSMSGLPGGLSEAIARQLERAMGFAPAAAPPGPAAAGAAGPFALPGAAAVPRPGPAPLTAPAADDGAAAPAAARPLAFIREHRAAAERAAAETGLPAEFLLAQAAHETGWGRAPIRHADGASAHNLFGIKAGPGWNGPVAEVTTTEYEGGVARKVTARFRAYASPADSFADYARLMRTSPRYREMVAQVRAETAGPAAAAAAVPGAAAERFAHGLQRAGYATDPAYADKLTRVINTTLRLQRAQQA
jgi:flagellar protein FlgJ